MVRLTNFQSWYTTRNTRRERGKAAWSWQEAGHEPVQGAAEVSTTTSKPSSGSQARITPSNFPNLLAEYTKKTFMPEKIAESQKRKRYAPITPDSSQEKVESGAGVESGSGEDSDEYEPPKKTRKDGSTSSSQSEEVAARKFKRTKRPSSQSRKKNVKTAAEKKLPPPPPMTPIEETNRKDKKTKKETKEKDEKKDRRDKNEKRAEDEIAKLTAQLEALKRKNGKWITCLSTDRL